MSMRSDASVRFGCIRFMLQIYEIQVFRQRTSYAARHRFSPMYHSALWRGGREGPRPRGRRCPQNPPMPTTPWWAQTSASPGWPKGLSQSELARRLAITFQQVQKLRERHPPVGAGRLVRIAQALDVSVTALLAGIVTGGCAS